eukprot:TRINITY_DN2815_c0_g1_i1.p1 TRINITY_DN2815_c0_g1~~TRINITY_DN2815_c0_g1_i1.p1  ORF type:complete len:629 (+),score=214.23 TRINITY_DN2815_c0_g1_i1:86-1972(+)
MQRFLLLLILIFTKCASLDISLQQAPLILKNATKEITAKSAGEIGGASSPGRLPIIVNSDSSLYTLLPIEKGSTPKFNLTTRVPSNSVRLPFMGRGSSFLITPTSPWTVLELHADNTWTTSIPGLVSGQGVRYVFVTDSITLWTFSGDRPSAYSKGSLGNSTTLVGFMALCDSWIAFANSSHAMSLCTSGNSTRIYTYLPSTTTNIPYIDASTIVGTWTVSDDIFLFLIDKKSAIALRLSDATITTVNLKSKIPSVANPICVSSNSTFMIISNNITLNLDAPSAYIEWFDITPDQLFPPNSTSTSTSTFQVENDCTNHFSTFGADCSDPTNPVILNSTILNSEFLIPSSISTLTFRSNLKISENSSLEISATLENSGKIILPQIVVGENLTALGDLNFQLEFQVENPENISGIYTLFTFDEMIGDFRISVQVENPAVKRSVQVENPAVCGVGRKFQRSYAVEFSPCGNLAEISPKTPDMLILAIVLPVGFVLIVAVVVVVVLLRRNFRKRNEKRKISAEDERRSLALRNLKLNDVKVFGKIGGGNFGEVFSGDWNGTKVALKRMNEGEEYFVREMETMSTINHPNIVQYFGIAEVDDRMYICMEWMSMGSLLDHIHTISQVEILIDMN